MFFKSTLTVPKIKDLVNFPNQKYKNIYDTLSHNTSGNSDFDFNGNFEPNPNSYTNIDLLPSTEINEQNNMKDELKSFLKKQLNNV